MIKEEELNKQAVDIKPSGIRKFFDIAASKKDVISLGVGEPDFITPYHIREAGINALTKGKTFYTANRGMIELRKAICDYYKRRFNLYYNPYDNVIVTVGGSEGIDLALRSIINEGDDVILPTPGYVAYSPMIEMAKANSIEILLSAENNFKLTKEDLQKAITPKTKAIIMNFPNNPTGGIMTYDDYKEIVPIIKEHNLFVISDEIYAELTYDYKHVSIASFDEIKDHVVIVNGFSKAYSMTGYRIGYLLADKYLISIMNKVHQYGIMCAPTVSQFAAIEAANNGDKDAEMMHDSFLQRRNYIVKELNRIGLDTNMPQGAFYTFSSIKKTGLTSQQFCEKLLEDENVALVPGDAFGQAGEGYVRISYAYSLENLKIALSKIEHFLKQFE